MDNWTLCVPAEIQNERDLVLAAIEQAMRQPTQEAVQKAGTLAWDWVGRHPEDYVVWDACEPLSLLVDDLKEKLDQSLSKALILSH